MRALSLLLFVPGLLPSLYGLHSRFRRQRSSRSSEGHHHLSNGGSLSPSLLSSPSNRPSGWRRVLSFGGIGGEYGTAHKNTQYFRDLYYLSAVPDASLNNETASSKSSSSSAADTAAALRQEAQEWRRRAQEIKKEVQSMEAEMLQTRSSSQHKRQEAAIDLTDRMFRNRPLTPEACAQVMREEKWTAEEAQMVLDSLFAQAYAVVLNPASDTTTTNETAAMSSTDSTPKSEAPLQVSNATETLLIEAKMDCLINAAEILDEISMASKDSVRRWSGRVGSALRARRNELRKTHEQVLARQVVVYQGAPVSSSSAAVNASTARNSDYQQGPSGILEDQGQWSSRVAVNSSQSSEQIPMVPLWVPSTLLEFLAASPSRIDPADITTLKEKVLSGTAFFCTSSESIAKAAILRGNIRGIDTTDRNATATVMADIQRRMRDEGLSENLQIFLLPDPEWRPNRDQTVAQEPAKPVILVIPADVVPDESQLRKRKSVIRKAMRATAAFVPVLTTMVYSVSTYALNPKFFDAVMRQRGPSVLARCAPIFAGLFLVHGIHELAHIVVARRRGIKIGAPFPIPSFQFGLFGNITPLRSFPKDRTDLLDFALAGPLSAMMVSVGMMIAGIRLTVRASGPDLLRFPMMPIYFLKSSFVAGALLTLFAPKSMVLPLSQPLPLHPLFMVGFASLMSSALNMLPIFRLDGGRACSAAMGSRFCAVTSSGTLVFMFSLALSSRTGVALTWGMLILLFQRRFEIPVRDELTEVDDVRLASWIATLAMAFLALAPFPGGACSM